MDERLNQEQEEAVLQTEGHVRVVAGAGTGKTRTLAHRFAFLVNDLGILPGNILCATFTNKAAGEMRQRIHTLTGDNDTGLVSTFHGFCSMVLQRDSHALGFPRAFFVMDNGDIDDILRQIYEERGLTLRDMTFARARDFFEMEKLVNRPDYYMDLVHATLDHLKEQYKKSESVGDILFNGYLYYARKVFGLDYNDLIVLTLHLFETREDIRDYWQDRLEYIMVDEFQDIDELQYRLVKALEQKHGNLFVVGDPDQTIYTWRGARLRWLLDFDNDFAGTTTITLSKNYRSTPQILDTCNSLIAWNTRRMEKHLVSEKAKGQKPVFVFETTRKKEMERIVHHIQDLLDTGIRSGDIAILYRAHYMSRSLEEALEQAEIPYRLYSGLPFMERKEIKDAHAWLRMLLYRDDLSFLRTVNTPRRNLGKTRMAQIKAWMEEEGGSLYEALVRHLDDPVFAGTGAKDYVDLVETLDLTGLSPLQALTEVLEKSGYEKMLRTEGAQERLDNLAELKQAVREFELVQEEDTTVDAYLRQAALSTGQDRVANNAVQLMTIHTAKGLEFDHVILVGMNESLFPSKKVRTLEAMEEERRLCFVAMTRAKETLMLAGNAEDGHPSRFLMEPQKETVKYEPDDAWLDESLVQNNRRFLEVSQSFPAGTRVLHPVFGAGTILDLDLAAGSWTVQFDNLKTTRTLSFKAKLKREDETEGRLLA